MEKDIGMFCKDGALPKDSLVAGFNEKFLGCAGRADRLLDMMDQMRSRIEDSGFINVHYQNYKLPLETLPKLQVYKDAGRVCAKQFKIGMDGWLCGYPTRSEVFCPSSHTVITST